MIGNLQQMFSSSPSNTCFPRAAPINILGWIALPYLTCPALPLPVRSTYA